jgi:hypothetical protein
MKHKLITPVLLCLLCAVTAALVIAVQNNHTLIKTNALLHVKLEERDIKLEAYRIDEAKKEIHNRWIWQTKFYVDSADTITDTLDTMEVR